MGYVETDCYLCKSCYMKIKKPSKKYAKKMVLTEYKEKCEECGRVDRLVEYTWEKEEDDE